MIQLKSSVTHTLVSTNIVNIKPLCQENTNTNRAGLKTTKRKKGDLKNLITKRSNRSEPTPDTDQGFKGKFKET